MRTCIKCGGTKPLVEFFRSMKGRDGRRTECASCHNAYSKGRRDARKAQGLPYKTAEQSRAADMKYHYGISVAEFDQMVAAQGGRCAICGTDNPGGKGAWHLDHDHRYDGRDRRGHRGLLCLRCNTGVGCFLDNPDTLDAAAAYLRRHRNGLRVVRAG